MPNRIAALNRGQCMQCDSPGHIFKALRALFVASFFRGWNPLEGRIEPDEA